MTTETPSINLLDVATYARSEGGGQPHEQFAWLRENDPVHWHEFERRGGFWAITRYDDIQTVSRNSEVFSSARGVMLDEQPEAAGGQSSMMLYMDPPRHTLYRKLVTKAFVPRAIQPLEPRITELAARIVDHVIERGECEFVEEIAGKMPSYMIAELMGIPLEDGEKLYELTEKMHTTDDAVVSPAQRGMAVMQMLGYANDIRNSKLAQPLSDIATILVESEVDGHTLTQEEFAVFFLLLVNAGGDTTRNLLAAGLETLCQHPDERRRLQRDLPDLLPSAIEEMLRFCSPVVQFRRTITRDIELGGKQLKADDWAVVFYGSGNRDPRAFEDPDRFDVTRTPNEHLAFGGGGAHYCLGAHLARLEANAMFTAIFTRMPDIELSGQVERLASNFIAGPRRMPVKFTPGRRLG